MPSPPSMQLSMKLRKQLKRKTRWMMNKERTMNLLSLGISFGLKCMILMSGG